MACYCFISNYFLTPLQLAVAAGLRQRNIRCVFIAVNRPWRDEILRQGWSDAEVLYLPVPPKGAFQPFDDLPIKFMDLLAADRALRFTPDIGLAYLNHSAPRILRFMKQHAVSHVFGEPTWAHERLVASLCRHLGDVHFLSPHTVRYPSGRWGFFCGEDQTELFEPAPAQSDAPQATATPISSEVQAPPSYLQRNNELIAQAQTLRGRLDRIKRFISRKNIDRSDPTFIQSRMDTLRTMGMEELNRLRYRSVKRTPMSEEVLSRPFVLYALHKQPESSIDVFGRYYEDQAALLRALWRTLPAGWWLYVKEHTNAIGDRPPAFFRALQRLPQVAVLDERIPASHLIEQARAVFTVSGTVAYEAAQRGVAAFTFAPMFFNAYPRCRRITLDDLRDAEDLRQLIAALPAHSTDAAEAVQGMVVRRSFPGRFTDVATDATVLAPGNVQALVDAFERVATGRRR